jgi:hypothetical protein
MKITKQQLKQIIKEELGKTMEDEAPALSAKEGMEKIQEIIQSSQMNKSFGFSPNVTHQVVEEIRSVLDAIYINELPKGTQL